jgi:aquaporin Z
MTAPTMFHRLAAEMIGTFWSVFGGGGGGSAVFAASSFWRCFGGDRVSRGGLAFGLTVLTGVYPFGPISGGHFNPASHWARRSPGVWSGRPCRAPGLFR